MNVNKLLKVKLIKLWKYGETHILEDRVVNLCLLVSSSFIFRET